MGQLSDRGPPEWHPATQDIRDICRKAAEYRKVVTLVVGFSLQLKVIEGILQFDEKKYQI